MGSAYAPGSGLERIVDDREHLGIPGERPLPRQAEGVGEEREHAGHVDCRNLECRCDCHHIGRASTEQGVSALWDADQHTAGYVDRAGWVTDGRTVSQAAEERKSA